MAKSAPPSSATPPQHFEAALAELETIVASMEHGDLALEASLAAYQRGVELMKFCQDKLGAAEQTVRILEGDLLRPLAVDGLDADGEDN